VDKDRVGELWRVLLHIQNIVSQINLLWLFGVHESENTVAINFVKRSDFFGCLFEICRIGKSTQ
jgi:hypothetical protein